MHSEAGSPQGFACIWLHSLFPLSLQVSQSLPMKNMLHGRDGVRWVMSCARFLPDTAICLQDEEFNFHFIRPQNLLPHALSLSRAFLQTPGLLSCAFFSGVVSVWPLSHKAEICEVLQRLLALQQVLPSLPRNSLVPSEWSLGSWSPPCPSFFLLGCSVWSDGQLSEESGSFHILSIS